MKILAFSDLHLGAGQEHRQDALADAAKVLGQIAMLAAERAVDLVLNAGDTFHRAKPAPAELHTFKWFCDSLAAIDVPMICLGGNGIHEAAPGQRSALELFESRWVRTSRRPECITEFAGAAVCTLPAATVGQLVARRNGGSREAAYQEAAELLVRAAADLFAEAPDDRPRLLLGHQMVSGASLPTGLPVEQVGSLVLPLEALEEIGYDVMVFGDIHEAQVLGNGTSFYCGSPMTMDFGEAGRDNACWLLDFDDISPFGSPIFEVLPLHDRAFVTIDVDLTKEVSESGLRPADPSVAFGPDSLTSQDSSDGRADSHEAERGLARLHAEGESDDQAAGMRARTPLPEDSRAEVSRHASGENAEAPQVPIGLSPAGPVLDETDRIAAAIAERFPLADAVVRVRVRAREDQWRRVDQPALERLVADAGARLYGGIQADLQREQQARAAGLSEALGPAEALAMWREAQEVPAEQAEALAGLLGEWAE